jgi:hypothetical protein
MAPCGFCKIQHFGGAYRLHVQDNLSETSVFIRIAWYHISEDILQTSMKVRRLGLEDKVIPHKMISENMTRNLAIYILMSGFSYYKRREKIFSKNCLSVIFLPSSTCACSVVIFTKFPNNTTRSEEKEKQAA